MQTNLRSNNWSIPILVGADFNMDMRNFDLSDHPGRSKNYCLVVAVGFWKALSKNPSQELLFLFEIVLKASPCTEINIVPYRPKSGKNRGMKNTFLFTMDNIQVIIAWTSCLKALRTEGGKRKILVSRGFIKPSFQLINVFQITEANYKMFHPEIFSSPWVQVTVRGRYFRVFNWLKRPWKKRVKSGCR